MIKASVGVFYKPFNDEQSIRQLPEIDTNAKGTKSLFPTLVNKLRDVIGKWNLLDFV